MKKTLTDFAESCRGFLESYREFNEKVYAPFTGRQRRGVVFCNIMLSLYVAVIIVLHSSGGHSARVAPFSAPLLIFAVYQAFKLFLLNHGNLHISYNKEKERLSWKTFVIASVITFVIFILNLLANFPGGFGTDVIMKWTQVQSGNFNNWHPAIYTMIIWLVTRILPEYSFFIGFQMMVFSVIVGYAATTLEAWGIKKRYIVLFMIAVISHSTTRNILLYAWKDTALTILLLCLTVYMLNIVLSSGKWLSKWHNICAIAIIGALATLVRHNGFFFMLPLGIILVICYIKVTRKILFAIATSTLLVLGVTRILYPVVGVDIVTDDPAHVFAESVGLPMTILSGVMARNPERLDDQTRQFMNRIATDMEWRATFELGNYNSVKFGGFETSRFVAEISPQELMLMTLRTIRNDPQNSLLNVIALTQMVWNPLVWHHGYGNIDNHNPEYIAIVTSERENAIIQPARSIGRVFYGFINIVLNMLIPTFMFSSIGLHMLLLLLAGVYSVNRNLGAKALVLFIPSVLYNLGTMLLLSAPDYRFFHFNTVITLPLIVALLAKNVGEIRLKTDAANS